MSVRENLDGMSFRQKSALITLILLMIPVISYAGLAVGHPPANVIAATAGLVGAMVVFTGLMILSHIVLAIAVGPKEAMRPSDERDRLIMLASRRNAGWVAVVGLWLILMLAVISAPHLVIAYAALSLFVLAEIVRYASQVVYYWRGI